MNGPRRASMTRRQALQGIAVAVFSVSSELMAPVAPAQAAHGSEAADARMAGRRSSTLPVGRVTGSLAAVCFARDWTTRFEIDCPAVVELREPTAVETTITVEWDDRVFEVEPCVMVSRHGRNERLTVVPTESGKMNFVVPVGTSALYLRPRARATYPAENIGQPRPCSIALNGESLAPTVVSEDHAAPWGIELRAVWESSEGYSYPTEVEVLSVGPNPVPAGVSVVVRSYRGVGSLASKVRGRASGGKATKQNTVVDRTFQLDGALVAGEGVRVSLDAQGRKSGPGAATSQAGQVFVMMPESASASARATGRYSIASVTSSGTELADSFTARRA